MTPRRITDPEDPAVAPFRQVRERDLVGREGRFVAEGEVVLRHLLGDACRHEAEAVLIAEDRWDKLKDVLETAACPVFLAEQPVMDAVAGFAIHRGILGIGRKAEPLSVEALLARSGQGDLVLAAVGIGNHDNMGGLFRAAAAFGVRGVILDGTCCDPLYRKAIRVSVGAALITPFVRVENGDELIDACDDHGYAPLALTPSGEERLIDVAASGPTAVIVGPEGPGLSDRILARCRRISIPMSTGFDSLNVATAAALALHQLRFAGQPAG